MREADAQADSPASQTRIPVHTPLKLTGREMLRLALETEHDLRTIERFAAGINNYPGTRARIERAMAKLGIERREKIDPKESAPAPRRRVVTSGQAA